MLSAIYFDYQAGLETHEVYDVRADWLLTLELPPRQSVRAQLRPEMAFSVGHAATQGLGYMGAAVWHGLSEFSLYPSPQPSPARGEGEPALRVRHGFLAYPFKF